MPQDHTDDNYTGITMAMLCMYACINRAKALVLKTAGTRIAPEYLISLLSMPHRSNYSLRSSKDTLYLNIPRVDSKKGEASFDFCVQRHGIFLSFLRMRPAAILLLEGAATIPRLLGMGWSG